MSNTFFSIFPPSLPFLSDEQEIDVRRCDELLAVAALPMSGLPCPISLSFFPLFPFSSQGGRALESDA